MQVDLAAIEEQMTLGKSFKIKYRYPQETGTNRDSFGVRSDKLMDVSVELGRFYTLFHGSTPIWLEEDEILELSPDDGIYEEFDE
jgi:hypothetical protein